MLVGVSGFAGSGKDEVGKILVAEQGFRRVAFADKVRETVRLADGDVDALVSTTNWDYAKMHPWVRERLQRFAMAARSVLGPDVWLDAALVDVDPLFDDVVFTDVRFPNEAQRIRELGGVVWRIIRPGTEPVNSHASETALTSADADVIIYNDSTLQDLQSAVLTHI